MKEEIGWIALATKVIVVNVVNRIEERDADGSPYEVGEIFDWAAYIDAVPGINHDGEYMDVKRRGSKLPKDVANALFPHLDVGKYRL